MNGAQVKPAVMAGEPGSQQERRMDFQYRSGDEPLAGFTIKRGVGWGGFGEVYYALSASGKEVALKLVRRHLDVELRGVSQCINLKSPHLVTIFDVKENERGESWIVMEYVGGPSLQQRLAQVKGPIANEEFNGWLGGVAAGVDYLHRNGIVHRDLKPGNVFRDEETVKIGDYGLSKFISVSRRSGQTQSVGTVHYMAPEISTGNYGKSVDIYSTAVIAFEMLTGDVPFDGETPGEVLMKHLTAAPNLALLESKFQPVFAKALAKAPEARFPSCKELLEAIDAVRTGRPIPVVNVSSPAAPISPPPAPAPVPTAPVNSPFAETVAGYDDRMQYSLPPMPGTFAAKRREWSGVVWQVFLAGLLAAVLPAVTGQVYQAFDGSYKPRLAEYVSEAAMTGLTSAVLLLSGFAWHKLRTEGAARHFHSLMFGLALGVFWFGLNVWLLRIEPDVAARLDGSNLFERSVVKQLGPHLLGYLTLCGVTFAIPDWFLSMDPRRQNRVSFAWVVWPAVVAFFIASMIGELDAFEFAAVLGLSGLIVQWVSPHESFLARRRRQRRQFAGR